MIKQTTNLPVNLIKINDLSKTTPTTTSEQKLKKACTDFEAIMLRQLLGTMEGTTKMFGKGFGGDYFQDFFNDEMSKKIAGKGFGLAEVLYAQLTKYSIKAPGEDGTNSKPADTTPITNSVNNSK